MTRRLVLALVFAALVPAASPHDALAKDDEGTKMTLRVIAGPANRTIQKALTDPIEILAWSWGASRSAAVGASSVQDISMTKYAGLDSPSLFALVSNGGTIPKAVIEIKSQDFVTITLYDVYISSISTGGSGGESRLTENISLSFGAYEIETQVTDQGGLKQTRSSGKIKTAPPTP